MAAHQASLSLGFSRQELWSTCASLCWAQRSCLVWPRLPAGTHGPLGPTPHPPRAPRAPRRPSSPPVVVTLTALCLECPSPSLSSDDLIKTLVSLPPYSRFLCLVWFFLSWHQTVPKIRVNINTYDLLSILEGKVHMGKSLICVPKHSVTLDTARDFCKHSLNV